MTEIHKIQILYQSNGNDEIVPFLREESDSMARAGFLIGTHPKKQAQLLLYRGATIWKETDYPRHPKMIQGWEEYKQTLFLSQYYPLLEDITIPTFFCRQLNVEVEQEIHKRGWLRAFVKNDVSALVAYGTNKSTWPDTTFEEMRILFSRMPETQMFAIRKHIDIPLYAEERYWVINGQVFHQSGFIPSIVMEAVDRLKVTGSKYYTIDATPEFIVEINPGETSDRYYENSPEVFASWFKHFMN